MPAFRDRSRERVGRLTILCEASERIGGRVSWHCRCDCGAEVVRPGRDLYAGRTTSCGCLLSETRAAMNEQYVKHGHARGHKPTREWKSWQSMLQRCSLPTMPNYHLYGGRGITVCPEWQGETGFQQFLSDMGERPAGRTLDRINSDGNYEPSNCRWATASEQSCNRRQTASFRESQQKNLAKGRKHWPRKAAVP